MEHVFHWPSALNYPYYRHVVGAIADTNFWDEVLGCYLCRAKFIQNYQNDYPEINEEVFWEELELFLDDNHLLIGHIADYFKAQVLIFSGGCSGEQREQLEAELLHVYCHFLICRKCSAIYENIAERVVQENSRVEAVFKDFHI